MSFLASLLSVINDKEEEAQSSKALPPIIGSASSAFTRLPTNQTPPSKLHDQDEPVRDSGLEASPTDGQEQEEGESSEEVPLNEQITDIVDVVEDVWDVIRTIQQAVLTKNKSLKETM